jgi:amino acid permease
VWFIFGTNCNAILFYLEKERNEESRINKNEENHRAFGSKMEMPCYITVGVFVCFTAPSASLDHIIE